MTDFREYSELYHHGVKGQRWGVRRYQNPDGTLTDVGKKRLKLLNDYSAYVQEGRSQMSDLERYMKGNLTDKEKEYMPGSSKALLKYAQKSPTYNALYKWSMSMSNSIMKKYENKINKMLDDFKKDGVTLKEIEKFRPLYTGNVYVERVFKQFDIDTKK